MVEELILQAKAHAMCLQFMEGYRLDGVRVSKGLGKIKALEILLEKLPPGIE